MVPAMTDPVVETVERQEQLAAVVEAVAAAPWVALDTESNSMFVYRERICLLQLNAGGRLFLVDTLALPYDPATYAALAPLLEDPRRTCWLHGGEYDVTCLKRDFGIALGGVWDSQQAASFLGWDKTGYGAAVERVCGVTLSKAYTQYDWGTRPLDPEARQYAIDDVRYLPQVCAALRAEIAAHGLEEELAIANDAVMASAWNGGFDPAGFWRIKGARDLPLKAMPVLAAIYRWRDGLAQQANLPPGRVVNNEALLALARTAPTNWPGLRRLGLKAWFLRDHGEALLTLLKDARATPDDLPPPPRAREVPPEEREREQRLKDWRRGESERRQVPLQVVLPAKALEHLKQHGAGDLTAVPQLGAKRIGLYGEKLRQLCR